MPPVQSPGSRIVFSIRHAGFNVRRNLREGLLPH
jgi:hypothetical protein